jgi:CBS domain-containing protein
MRQHRGEALVVCRGERVAGVLTDADVLHRVLGRDADPAMPVEAFMTPDPGTLSPDATLVEALVLMDRQGDRAIPLVEPDGRLEGILHGSDVLAFVAEAFPQEILNLPPRPDQVADQPEGG